MHDFESLSHVRWECKYHVVFIPKYRQKVFYGTMRKRIGSILRDLCRQRGVDLLEGHCMPDHIHMCLSIPPKYSVSHTIGFLKGKSAVRVHREVTNHALWAWLVTRAAAEANLLEAHTNFVRAPGPFTQDTRDPLQALVDLCTGWDKAEPGKSYDAKAAEWKAKFDSAVP